MNQQWTARKVSKAEDNLWNDLMRVHPMARCVVPMWDEQAGWTLHRIGLFSRGTLVGGMVLSDRRIPRLPMRLGRITCAMVGSDQHADMLDVLLTEVERVAKKRSIIEIEFRLRIPADDAVQGFGYHVDISERLRRLGYEDLEMVDKTYLVRIDKDDDEILKSFHPKCRNAIRKALKSGVEITPATDPELLDQFHNSYAAMCKRKGAPMIEKKSVVDGMKRLIEKNHVLLFVERYAGQISNMVLVDTLGLPCYMLGTRTAASVEGKVPSHAQAVLYEVMRYLRDQGKIYYDLGGCEGPKPIEGHPNYGVWRFKYSFRGTYVEFLPYFRKARGPVTRCLLNLAHRVRGDYM